MPRPVLSGFPSANTRDLARLDACYATLERMRGANGLYLASPSADYSKAWLRDNVYEALPYADKPTPHYEETYASLMHILRRHEWKIDAMLRAKPADRDAYIHARFHPETFREFEEPWGNKQNDATGALLFGIAQGLRSGKRILRDERDRRLVQKLVRMHAALRYWEDADNGMWEEAEEVHASSIGAVLGGLLAIRDVGFDVPQHAIDRGREALDALLPRESATKDTDLALLSLIYPYRVVSDEQRKLILRDVEAKLLRERGVIRYEGDSYYSTLAQRHGRECPREFYHGSEAEWTFGLPWLSLVYREMGSNARADHFLERTRAVENAPGSLPELYYARTDEPNPNTPLGWSVAMHILAMEARSSPS
jgi:phosphorylase kinase alpha/beta subunit